MIPLPQSQPALVPVRLATMPAVSGATGSLSGERTIKSSAIWTYSRTARTALHPLQAIVFNEMQQSDSTKDPSDNNA